MCMSAWATAFTADDTINNKFHWLPIWIVMSSTTLWIVDALYIEGNAPARHASVLCVQEAMHKETENAKDATTTDKHTGTLIVSATKSKVKKIVAKRAISINVFSMHYRAVWLTRWKYCANWIVYGRTRWWSLAFELLDAIDRRWSV